MYLQPHGSAVGSFDHELGDRLHGIVGTTAFCEKQMEVAFLHTQALVPGGRLGSVGLLCLRSPSSQRIRDLGIQQTKISSSLWNLVWLGEMPYIPGSLWSGRYGI